MIVSGLIKDLKVDQYDTLKINNTELVRIISSKSKELQPKDYLRILMIYVACFDLPPKDKNTLMKSLHRENYRVIL